MRACLTCDRDLISMKQRGDRQAAGGEQLQANAIVQAYCSTLDAYINAQVVGCTQHGTCVVTLLGVTETLEVEVSSVNRTLQLLLPTMSHCMCARRAKCARRCSRCAPAYLLTPLRSSLAPNVTQCELLPQQADSLCLG